MKRWLVYSVMLLSLIAVTRLNNGMKIVLAESPPKN